ncbi:hypothetical protein C8R44DRAFT_793135 [Mycena epipterygia]|nr:hypothetical protein C8R44DRAFT_793135 [Mycena epipterygia]
MMSNLPSLDGTLGNLEIGLVLATFLYGIQTLQTFNYYCHAFRITVRTTPRSTVAAMRTKRRRERKRGRPMLVDGGEGKAVGVE